MNGQITGSIGDCGTYSFDFYKTITTGEGGMIVTNDPQIYKTASEYSDHGHDHNPDVGRALEGRSFLGFNYRMNELQGAVGLAQLGRLPDILKIQDKNHSIIAEAMNQVTGIQMRAIPENARIVTPMFASSFPKGPMLWNSTRKFLPKELPPSASRTTFGIFWEIGSISLA